MNWTTSLRDCTAETNGTLGKETETFSLETRRRM